MAWSWWVGTRRIPSLVWLKQSSSSTLAAGAMRFFFGLLALAVFLSSWTDFMCLFRTPEKGALIDWDNLRQVHWKTHTVLPYPPGEGYELMFFFGGGGNIKKGREKRINVKEKGRKMKDEGKVRSKKVK
jgi:hypothetical protein